MDKVQFDKAYYIKLGVGGAWEDDSIKSGKIRIGWKEIRLEDIQKSDWDKIKEDIQEKFKNRKKIKGATQDFNALKNIYNADNNTVFITFYASKLWWCRVKDENEKERIKEDDISKYREVNGKWSAQDVNKNVLLSNQISGKLGKLQRFPATCCDVKERVCLKHLINATHSQEYNFISEAKKELIFKIKNGIKSLHPKDFEILVDLVFRQAGWRRLSMLGEIMKSIDIELQEPITGEQYHVQVKSSASKKNFEEYAKQFNQFTSTDNIIKKFYFVVHSPDKSLLEYANNNNNDYKNVELIFADKLAEMVVDGGLVDWLMKKIQ